MKHNKLSFLVISRVVSFLVLLLMGLQAAQASHFRFGHLTWEPRPDISPTTVDFTFLGAFRRNGYGGTAPDGRPQIGDVIWERIGGTRLNFGDGSSTSTLYFEVVAYSAAENWVLGVARQSRNATGVIRKTYNNTVQPNGNPWLASVSGCCRINLRNPSSSYVVRSLIDLGIENTPPVSNIPPIVTCPRGNICSFAVPATDFDQDNLRWRLSTRGESGVNSIPSGLTINSTTGIISWSTAPNSSIGLYALSVTIEDLTEEGAVKSSVAVDFLINLQDFANNAAPEFDVPPTPASNSTIQAPIGRLLTINLSASDSDVSDTVSLSHVGLPLGSNFTPVSGNPGTAVFQWTPNIDNLGEQIVTFTATDNHNRSALPHPIKINVINAEIRNVRVIAKVLNTDIEIDSTSFAQMPSRIDIVGNMTEVEWRYPTFSATQTESLDFNLLAKNLIPGEQRLVTESVELVYEDINGVEVRQQLGQQTALVLSSIFDITAATDKGSYSANETALITSEISNLSQFDQVLDIKLTVQDSDGVLVKDFGITQDVSIAAGQTWQHPQLNFNTGSTFEGLYQVHAQLLDQQGAEIDMAFAPFLITAPTAVKVSGAITTDKLTYVAFDQVNIQSRVSNTTPNATLEGYTATTTVYNPNNDILWSTTENLPQLLPNTLKDLNYSVALNSAPAGHYRAELLIKDQQGVERALSETVFIVQSTAVTGSGLTGSITVQPNPVLKTEFLDLSASVSNSGNSALNDIPLTVSIIDPENEAVIAEWVTVSDLAINQDSTIQEQWRALGPVGSTYIAVLSANVAGETKYLARTTFVIAEKIVNQMRVNQAGRILILLDPPVNPNQPNNAGGFEDNEVLNRQRVYLENLLTENGWSYTIVTDADSFAKELRSHAYTQYALFSAREKLSEQVQKELREAVYRGEGLVQAGDHDQRYNQLDEALGTLITGKHNRIDGFGFVDSEWQLDGQANWFSADKPLKAQLQNSAQAVAYYLDINNQNLAIARNTYGEGKTVFIGFDLLDHASLDGANALHSDLLLAALKDTTPAIKDSYIAGDPVPVQLLLSNNGTATTVQTSVTLPVGTEILDASGTEITADGIIIWTTNLANQQSDEITLWLRMPMNGTEAVINTEIRVGEVASWIDYDTSSLSISLQANVVFTDVVSMLEALTPANDYKPALQAVNKALLNFEQGQFSKALQFLVQASDSLIRLNSAPAAILRKQLDLLIIVVGSKV